MPFSDILLLKFCHSNIKFCHPNICLQLLNYATTTLLFSDKHVDSAIISWNRVVLLHGEDCHSESNADIMFMCVCTTASTRVCVCKHALCVYSIMHHICVCVCFPASFVCVCLCVCVCVCVCVCMFMLDMCVCV